MYGSSSYYRRAFDEAGLDPVTVQTRADYSRVPYMDKHVERACQADEPPFGTHLSVDPADLVRVHASSGTTGTPTFFALTADDVAMWTRVGADAFRTMGIRRGDIYGALGNFSMFVGGIPAIDAAGAAGACVVPIGSSAGTERTLQLVRDLGVNVIGATPSFAIHLGELVRRHLSIEPIELGVRMIIIGGEPGAQIPAIRAQIANLWGCVVRDAMGMGEIAGTIWAESGDEDGMHLTALDDVYVELIDPDTLQPMDWDDGAVGELVYTTATRQATPLIRFRSFDRVLVKRSPVRSGRTSPRIKPLGRTDDMLLVRGVNVFPSAVQDVVASFAPETTGHLQIRLNQPGPLVTPPLHVAVEVGPAVPADDRSSLVERIESAIKVRLNFRAVVEPVEAESLPRTALKSQLVVVDRRSGDEA